MEKKVGEVWIVRTYLEAHLDEVKIAQISPRCVKLESNNVDDLSFTSAWYLKDGVEWFDLLKEAPSGEAAKEK